MKRYRLQRRLIGPPPPPPPPPPPLPIRTSSLKKHERAIDGVLKQAIAQLRSLKGAEVDLKEWMHIIVVECLGAVVLSWSPGYPQANSDCGSSAHGYQHWKRRSVFGLFPAAVTEPSLSENLRSSLCYGLGDSICGTGAGFQALFPSQ